MSEALEKGVVKGDRTGPACRSLSAGKIASISPRLPLVTTEAASQSIVTS